VKLGDAVSAKTASSACVHKRGAHHSPVPELYTLPCPLSPCRCCCPFHCGRRRMDVTEGACVSLDPEGADRGGLSSAPGWRGTAAGAGCCCSHGECLSAEERSWRKVGGVRHRQRGAADCWHQPTRRALACHVVDCSSREVRLLSGCCGVLEL
jgi:hypothetical protein